MKKIIPIKLITELNPDGSAKSSLLQYKIDIDGAVKNEFYTMTVSAGIKLEDMNKVTTDSIAHVNVGEKITKTEEVIK